MTKYKKDILHFLTHPGYMAAIVLTTAGSYGFTFFNVTIGRDSLEGDRYIGDGNIMLTTGRFGMNFWAWLLGYGEAEPMYAPIINFMAAVLLVMAAMMFCVLLRKLCEERISMFGYGLFSCLLISYPLMNEIWEYAGANVCVCGGYLLDAVALNCMYDILHEPKMNREQKAAHALAAVLGLTVVCAAYESLAAVFVLGVFTILTLEQLMSCKKKPFRRLFKNGCVYAAALVAALILRVVLQFLLPVILHVSTAAGNVNGETELKWLTMPFREVVRWLVRNCIIYYGMRGCFYLPILEFVVALMLFVLLIVVAAVQNRSPSVLLTGGGMLLSLVLLALIQGSYSPYRTCQTFSLFVALTVLAVYELVKEKAKMRSALLYAVQIFAILLCLRQTVYLNHLLVLDHLRSDEEASAVRSIGTELSQVGELEKPIVIVGAYTLNDTIINAVTADTEDNALYHAFQQRTGWEEEKTIRIVESNCNSVLSWAVGAFRDEGSYGSAMQKLFSYYGFDLQMEHSEEMHEQAIKYCEENKVPAYPAEGYIMDCGNFVLVNLG